MINPGNCDLLRINGHAFLAGIFFLLASCNPVIRNGRPESWQSDSLKAKTVTNLYDKLPADSARPMNSTDKHPILGQWESLSNSKYKVYFEFLNTGRYRKWSMKKFKPSEYTGKWEIIRKDRYTLHDCYRGDISLRIYGIDSLYMNLKCGYFDKNDIVNFKRIDTMNFFSQPLEMRLLGENIILGHGSGRHVISAGMSAEAFEAAVCNLDLSKTIRSSRNNDFEVLYVKGPLGDTLFHAFSVNGDINPIIIDSEAIKTDKGIHVGSTLDEVKSVYREISLQRSEVKDEIIGTAGELRFSLGRIKGMLNLIPGKMQVKQIIL